MCITMRAPAVLDRCFLEMRARILEVGAALDRLDRAEGFRDVAADARLKKLAEAISMLNDGQPDRVARIQMLFSDPYDPQWRHPRGG